MGELSSEIEQAVTRWAGQRFAAPRRFHTLITGVEVHDEIIDRVATCIERRDLHVERVPTAENRITRPRVDVHAIDPFAYTADALKMDTEQVAQCTACGASGRMRCTACSGTGNGRCPTCHGSGHQTSAKTGRPIQCKACRASGSAPCRNCGGQGSVPCRGCMGSGHQLTWLTIKPSEHWSLFVPEQSSFVIAHPAMRAMRAIQRQELSDAAIVGEYTASCPLDVQALPPAERGIVAAQLAPIDRRFERVRFQQYVRLAAIRRDVTYEMCGTRATLSLSGTSLTPATTPASTRPIRRRLYGWIALCLAVLGFGAAVGQAVVGKTGPYEDALGGVSLLAVLGCAMSIPLFGTLLRAWRGGVQFRPVHRRTLVWAAGMLACLIAIPFVALHARAGVAERIARAAAAAAQAAAQASEERAHGHDVRAAACTTPACTLDEVRRADAERTTPARVQAVSAARGEALKALDPARLVASPLAARVQQLAGLGDTGAAIGKLAPDDAELQAAAHAAIKLAADERAAVAVLGHDLAVAEALLGAATRRDDGVAMLSLEGASVYLTFDRAGACTGVYATGGSAAARTIAPATAEHLLSQAVGQATRVPSVVSDDDSTRWSAAGWPVVVRRTAGEVAELRIGDATP